MYEYKARVIRIVDGDTVELEVDCGFRLKFQDRFRLAKINAPELNAEGGQESKDYLKSKLKVGEYCDIITTKPDKYGRWLATIYVNKMCINDLMVEAGMATKYNV